MSNEDDTATTPPRREKGPLTVMKEASALARERELEDRAATDKKDARQDDRTDRAWDKAISAAEKGQASAERTTKLLYLLLAASMLANVVLMAMKYETGLDVSREGVSVGAPLLEGVEQSPLP